MLQFGHCPLVRIALAYEEETKYDKSDDEERSNTHTNTNDGGRGQYWSSSSPCFRLARYDGHMVFEMISRHGHVVIHAVSGGPRIRIRGPVVSREAVTSFESRCSCSLSALSSIVVCAKVEVARRPAKLGYWCTVVIRSGLACGPLLRQVCWNVSKMGVSRGKSPIFSCGECKIRSKLIERCNCRRNECGG